MNATALRTPLLIALCAAAGCAAARPSASPSAASGPPQAESLRYAVEPAPSLLVLASNRTFLLLGAAPVADARGRPELSLSYLAAADPERALDPGVEPELVAGAEDLFQAFRAQAESDGQRAVVISAVFGRPAEAGVVAQLRFEREGEDWARRPLERHASARLPPAPQRVERAEEAERAGEAAARKFIEDVDGVELDQAWSATSAVVKAVTSRVTFEHEVLDLVARRGVASGRRVVFCRYLAGAQPLLLPGSELLVRFESRVAQGRIVEELRLRRDDDQEWRVAGAAFGRVGEASAKQASASRAPGAPRADAAR